MGGHPTFQSWMTSSAVILVTTSAVYGPSSITTPELVPTPPSAPPPLDADAVGSTLGRSNSCNGVEGGGGAGRSQEPPSDNVQVLRTSAHCCWMPFPRGHAPTVP
jgi:hypothetical protein